MRVLVIGLIVLGLAFTGVVIFGLVRHGTQDRSQVQLAEGVGGPTCPGVGSSGPLSGAPRMDGDEIDEDALEDWRPPALGEVMACALAPFAPKLALDQPIVEAGADALRPAQRIAPRDPHGGKDSMRIARVGWRSGAPMLVRHDCSDDDTCQEICLCPSGVAYDEDLFDDCRKSWVKRRKTNDGRLLCRDGDNAGALVIHRNGGLIEFRGLGGPSVAEIN